MIPSIGQVVLYTLAAPDVTAVAAQRSSPNARGNPVQQGGRYPALMVSTSGDAPNLLVFLDGPDTLWVTGCAEGTGAGQWCWPSSLLSDRGRP